MGDLLLLPVALLLALLPTAVLLQDELPAVLLSALLSQSPHDLDPAAIPRLAACAAFAAAAEAATL